MNYIKYKILLFYIFPCCRQLQLLMPWSEDKSFKIKRTCISSYFILFKDAYQIRYKSPSKKLDRGSKSSAGGFDSRADI